jgi:two-component system chemotaxis sensor kinase CheA
MNEFIEQFLIECRELVEQAVADLLALEQSPGDHARLDSAFRAFHTLRGSAGIVEFAAMGRALTAAEDALSAVRSGEDAVTTDMIGDSLTCLDQVVQWLDQMETLGEPPTDAGPAADGIIARFARTPSPVAELRPASPWWDDLLAAHATIADRARTAIRYTPGADAFLRGEDPLTALAQVPGFLALDIQPAHAAPPLDVVDPFACNMILTALSSAHVTNISSVLSPVADQVELRALDDALPVAARALIQEQILLLAEPAEDGRAGRIASALTVAVNVLRYVGWLAEAESLRDLDQDGDGLAAALEALLTVATPTPAIVVEPVALSQQDAAPRALRVDVERIDALVRLAGEMTVIKNAVGHAARLAQDGGDPKILAARLKDSHGHLERLVDELQHAVLSIRVLPMRHVFHRFPRLVREIGASLGKPIRLVTEGEDAEADKAVVEALFEPLLHVLRNAIDHGVEAPEERAARGKPEAATVVLRAAREGDHVVVEVTDDGRGIQIERVRQIAQERGMGSPEALAAMSEGEVANLVFAPGFSTATAVSDLSGRGVGMDAVRVAIERLGGQVRIESRARAGTIVRFTLPFTVMMSRVMTVEVGGQMFGIPLEEVVETVRIGREQISPIGAARAFVLRSQTLPLCDLAQSLGIAANGPEAADVTVVVAALADQLCGVQVDRVGEPLDVMLKPMEGLLSGMPGVAGTALMGDGRVLIVLDLRAILQ